MVDDFQNRVLILEDDTLFAQTLEDILEEEGFKVELAFNPQKAFELSYEKRFDLYIFDINLPIQNGLLALKELRASGDETPTIFLTSREDKKSLLEGFKVGRDDYLKKTIDLDEFLLRVKALLKRSKKSSITKLGKYKIDRRARDLVLNGKHLHIGVKVFMLLELLIENIDQIVTIEQIKQRLWENQEDSSYGAVRVYITRLKKLFPDGIENIRGVGYRLDSQKISKEK